MWNNRNKKKHVIIKQFSPVTPWQLAKPTRSRCQDPTKLRRHGFATVFQPLLCALDGSLDRALRATTSCCTFHDTRRCCSFPIPPDGTNAAAGSVPPSLRGSAVPYTGCFLDCIYAKLQDQFKRKIMWVKSSRTSLDIFPPLEENRSDCAFWRKMLSFSKPNGFIGFGPNHHVSFVILQGWWVAWPVQWSAWQGTWFPKRKLARKEPQRRSDMEWMETCLHWILAWWCDL